jgi:hypothetical protein
VLLDLVICLFTSVTRGICKDIITTNFFVGLKEDGMAPLDGSDKPMDFVIRGRGFVFFPRRSADRRGTITPILRD